MSDNMQPKSEKKKEVMTNSNIINDELIGLQIHHSV